MNISAQLLTTKTRNEVFFNLWINRAPLIVAILSNFKATRVHRHNVANFWEWVGGEGAGT